MGCGEIVRGAGGVVSRETERGEVEVILVHSRRRRDWSFPKGKANPDESDEACAVREVEEETGLRCTLGAELPTTSFRDRKGRQRVVRYWAMRPTAGVARPCDEVDAVRWASLPEAEECLTWERDRGVLRAFARVAR